MKVAVTGSHGLIGSALVPALEAAGHDVVRLVRDPSSGALDLSPLDGVEGAVNLAGETIADKRWTDERKRKILNSRLDTTDLLARRLAKLEPRPKVLVSGSAIGFYGNRGDEELTEKSPAGTGYLADVVRRWEAATAPAERAGIRVVHIRTGLVLSAKGGILKRMLPLFKFGVGGKLGSGRQYQSWISIDDEVQGIVRALATDLSGPLNLTAPNPVTNADLTRTLGAVLGRPTLLSVPQFALSLALGKELTGEALLASQRVLPAKLDESGYQFADTHLEPTLRTLLGK